VFKTRMGEGKRRHGTFMKKICAKPVRRRCRGFSLLELLIVVGIVLVMAALAVPTLMTQVYAIRIQYSARDVSSLLQRARMEAVRKNSFYSMQFVAGNPSEAQVLDKNSVVVTTIPPAVLGNSVVGYYGLGNGAPAQATLMTALNFTAAAAGVNTLPSFDARGLPCVATTGSQTCVQTLGQGFVFFLSGTSASSGAAGWSAVAVTPSGRCEIFNWDGTNWNQQ
jgi:prepilin-type N-terminal cleavage/methylation domain-containing protein